MLQLQPRDPSEPNPVTAQPEPRGPRLGPFVSIPISCGGNFVFAHLDFMGELI